MAGDLTFDVEARNGASDEFGAIAAQLKDLARQLRDLDGKKARTSVSMTGAEKVSGQTDKIRVDVDKLDGRNAKVKVSLDAASSAPIERFSEQLRDLDGKTAKANVELTGADAVKAKVAGILATLKALPSRVAVAVNVDLDKSLGERLAGVTAGVQKLGSVSQSVLPSMSQLRTASQAIVSPGSLPIVERISDAISGKFHAAVDKARVVVDKLHTGTKILEGSLLGLGAVGNATQVIGGLTAALTQLSGVTLLLPGILAGAGAALTTLKVGFASFWDAVNADTPKKFAKATEDMSASAKASVIALRDLKIAMSGVGSIGKPVQTAMFRGIADQINTLNKTYIPVLKTGMTGIATGFNAMGREALIAVGKASSVSQVQTIFTNTSTAVAKMRLTLANAATGFLTLGAAGSAFLPRIGAAIDSAAAKFNSWSQRITSDGSFDRWVNNGITAFKQFGTIIGNIGSIIGSVFGALSASGGGALASFANLTGTVKDFLRSVEGSAALSSFATTVTKAGDALSQVLGAALKAVAPIVTALGPALQTLATSIGEHLSGAITAVTPALTRFAEILSANPEVLANIAKAVEIAAISFGPLVAILGVAGTLLKGLLLARVAAAAIGALGIEGTTAARVIRLLATPLSALRAELPLIAQGFGSLVARLLLFAGPVGAVIVLFSTLYATSSQFRDGMNDIAATIGRVFVKALQDAGSIINSTVALIGSIGSAVNSATSGLQSAGSSIMSVFGPLGRAVSGGLSGLFDVLGKLPGAALAAFAAFKVFGLIAPLFSTASAAVAGFSARMLAFQGASGAATVAATATGAAAGRVAAGLSKVGAALPLIGVALIALGFAYDAIRSKASEAADSVINGSQSMAQAVKMESEQLAQQSRLLPPLFDAKGKFIGLTSRSVQASDFEAEAYANVRAEMENQLKAMGGLDEAKARVAISTKNLADLQASGTASAQQIADATTVLARDQANLASMQQRVEQATKGTTAAMKAQQDQMSAQATSMLGYEASLRQVASAQKAADDAIKNSGANSAEAKDAIGSLAQAQLDAANKAKDLAVQMGATDGGVKAFSTTLASMPRDTAAGKAAFESLGKTMSQTELDMISAAAAATGLKTEVVNLPGGKTVRVVAEADKAKAIQALQQELQNLKDKTVTVNGNAQPLADAVKTVTNQLTSSGATINIDGNTVPAADALSTVLSQIAQGRSFVVIDGQAVPADQALQTFLGKVGTSGGMVTINGETMPAAQALALLLQTANGSTATPTIGANAAPGTAVLEAWKALANGSFGIPQLDANPGLANSVLGLWKSTSDATTGMPNIDAKSGKAEGVLAAWKALANGTTGIPALDSNPALANQILAAWKARSDATTGLPKVIPQVQAGGAEAQLANLARTRYTTIIATVVAGQSGAVPTATGVKRIAGGAIGGIVHPYAAGAVVEHYAAGGVRPLRPMRGDIAQRVPANSWRVIGDRPKGLEYFLPDDSTPRSMKIGAEWAKNRGLALVPRSGMQSPTQLPTGMAGAGGVSIAAARVASSAVRGASSPSLNIGPLIAQNRALLGQLQALTAAVAGGDGYAPQQTALLGQIAAAVKAGAGPAERAQSARYRSTMGALA